MPISKTKKKIIVAAVELFNELGIAQVRNQDIAKKSGISLSNFNYHYATKKDLVKATFDYMTRGAGEKRIWKQNPDHGRRGSYDHRKLFCVSRTVLFLLSGYPKYSKSISNRN